MYGNAHTKMLYRYSLSVPIHCALTASTCAALCPYRATSSSKTACASCPYVTGSSFVSQHFALPNALAASCLVTRSSSFARMPQAVAALARVALNRYCVSIGESRCLHGLGTAPVCHTRLKSHDFSNISSISHAVGRCKLCPQDGTFTIAALAVRGGTRMHLWVREQFCHFLDTYNKRRILVEPVVPMIRTIQGWTLIHGTFCMDCDEV